MPYLQGRHAVAQRAPSPEVGVAGNTGPSRRAAAVARNGWECNLVEAYRVLLPSLVLRGSGEQNSAEAGLERPPGWVRVLVASPWSWMMWRRCGHVRRGVRRPRSSQ